MSEAPSKHSVVFKFIGTGAVVANFGFILVVFWLARFWLEGSCTGLSEQGKSLNDFFWPHLGSSMLFVAFGAVTIGVLFVRPKLRLGMALAGVLVGVLTIFVFCQVIKPFPLTQGFADAVLHYLIIWLIFICGLVTAILLVVAITLLVRKQRAH